MAWTEEQKQAARERATAVHARKKAKAAEATEKVTEHYSETSLNTPQAPAQPSPTDYQELLKRVQELEQRQWTPQNTTTGPQAGPQGLVGTYEKYAVDPKRYPDPRERLNQESRLQRFAFHLNYELGWNISVSSYKTADGVNTKEPKFTIELYRVVMDDDGEPTTGRYTICRGIFHEDPDAALVVARDNGYQIEDWAEEEFLDEMRYMRIRDWLLEAFYPPKPQEKRNKREMVIDGKLVDYFEVNSEQSESIPFKNLTRKL